MTKEEIIGLIGIEKYLYRNCEVDPHGYEILIDIELTDIILDHIGFPKDNTVELGFNHKDSFCNDYLCEIIWDMNFDNKTTYRMLIGELNKLNLEQK